MFCEARAYSILVCVLIRLASDIGRDKVFQEWIRFDCWGCKIQFAAWIFPTQISWSYVAQSDGGGASGD